jgi:flagellin-like protein
MRTNREFPGTQERDEAVSPVIAVILMVAITVVLAATVYVWVSGFTDTSDQAPSANFQHVGCTVDSDEVTMKLTSGGPLQKDDIVVILFNATDDTEEARTDPLDDGGGASYDAGTVSTGDQITITEHTGSQPNWDAALSSSGGLDSDTQYSLDFVHKPTESTFASLPYTC